MRNPYRLLGIGLCVVGACFALGAYYVMDSVPLTAIGLSTIVIGIVCIALPNYRPYVSPEAWQMLLIVEMENTAKRSWDQWQGAVSAVIDDGWPFANHNTIERQG
jgi:hypothetical protein